MRVSPLYEHMCNSKNTFIKICLCKIFTVVTVENLGILMVFLSVKEI